MYCKTSILFFLTILFTACGKSTQECAEESLIGDWNITRIVETSTIQINGTPGQQSQSEYMPVESSFSFTVDMMDYEYTTTSVKQSNQDYTLEVTKENAGFTRVDVFTIIGEDENFKVRFGDQTDDAHEDATEMSLEQNIISDTLIINRFIELVRG